MESVDSFSYTPNTSALFYKNTSFCIFQVDLYFKYKFFVDKCSGKEGGIIITDQIKLHIHLDFFFIFYHIYISKCLPFQWSISNMTDRSYIKIL